MHTDDTAPAAPHDGATPPAAATPDTKKPGVRSSYEPGTGLVSITLPGADPVSFDPRTLPEAVRVALQGAGLRSILATSDDPASAYAKLADGTLPGRTPAKPKELDPWRQAYALALVEQTRKSEAPVALDAATERARALDAQGMRVARYNPLVVKHHAKLTGRSTELA